MSLLEALVDGGISPARMMPGTGQTNLPDTIKLSQHAMNLGCVGVMVLPPFYFKGVSDQGLYDYFEALIKGCPKIRIYLYHIPPVAVVGFSVALIKRLKSTFPKHIIGLKDSSGDWDNTRSVLEAVADLATFPGSELPLLKALRMGATGCITATANINAPMIVDLYHSRHDGDADEKQIRIAEFRKTVQDFGPIPAMKWLLSEFSGDPRWRVVRPPLEALDDTQGNQLLSSLRSKFGFSLSF